MNWLNSLPEGARVLVLCMLGAVVVALFLGGLVWAARQDCEEEPF